MAYFVFERERQKNGGRNISGSYIFDSIFLRREGAEWAYPGF
jgi:hypothetical protein